MMYIVYLAVLSIVIDVVRNDPVHPLRADVTTDIDIEARKEILIQIVAKIDAIVKAQLATITGCEEKINQTIDECNACRQDLCTPKVPLDVAIVKLLSSGANVPVVYAGKVIEDAGKWFNGAGNWFGDRAADYSTVLGNTANTIGDTLSAGGQEVYSAMASEFNKLSKDFLSTASKIEEALKDPLGGFLGLGDGIANLDSLIGQALSGAESTLNTVLNSLNSAGNDIKDWFTGIFSGKKRMAALLRDQRCVSSCPMCDDLDTDKYKMSEIMEKVCGAATVASQATAMDDITWLQAHTNYTYSGTNVTKIELDYGSYKMDFSTGSATVSTSYYTTDDGVRREYGSVIDMSDKTETGKGMAREYFPIRWTAARRS